MSRAYPLEKLREVRELCVDEGATALAARLDAAATAARESVAADARVAGHDAESRRVVDDERARLEGGASRAGDLAAGAAFDASRARAREGLVNDADVARSRSVDAAREAELARAKLEGARAEAEVVRRHEAEFRAVERARALAADDDIAEEAHAARRSRGAAS